MFETSASCGLSGQSSPAALSSFSSVSLSPLSAALRACARSCETRREVFDQRARLGGVEIPGALREIVEQLLGFRVVFAASSVERSRLVFCTNSSASRFFARVACDLGHVFTHGKRFAEPFRRALEFVVLQQKLERLHALAHVAERLISQRVERADSGRGAEGPLEQILRLLAEIQLRVAVVEDRAIKARGHEHVLVAALQKELRHQRLKLDLHLDFRELHLRLVGLDLRHRFHQSRGVGRDDGNRLDLGRIGHVAALARLAGRSLHLFVLAGHLRVPLVALALLLERLVGHRELVLPVLRAPDGINGIGDGVAQPCVDVEARSARQ